MLVKKKLKILVATSGVGAAQAIIPIVKALMENEHSVILFADGPSIYQWDVIGLSAFGAVCVGPDWQHEGHPTISYHETAEKMFDKHRPDLVLTGLTSSITSPMSDPGTWLEEVVGLCANQRNVPLVQVEDTWGAHKRSRAVPTAVVTLDDLGAEFIARDPRHANTIVWPTGHALVQSRLLSANVTTPISKTSVLMGGLHRLGMRSVLCIVEDATSAESLIRVAAHSILRTEGQSSKQCLLIVRAMDPSRGFMGWNAVVNKEAQQHPSILVAALDEVEHPTADLIHSCTVTMSTASVALLMSAASFRIPLCVMTEGTRSTFEKRMPGVGRHPLATQEIAAEVAEPVDLTPFLESNGTVPQRMRGKQNAYFKRWNGADLVVRHIEMLL